MFKNFAKNLTFLIAKKRLVETEFSTVSDRFGQSVRKTYLKINTFMAFTVTAFILMVS